MKLSAAVEKAIREGIYGTHDPYMCHALQTMGYVEHVHAVQLMIQTIHPTAALGNPLVCALDDSPNAVFCFADYSEDVSRKREFQHLRQLYCWWVFDLKRKGL